MYIRKLTTEIRVKTEVEVMPLIESFKEKSAGIITFKTARKTKKAKGEIIDEWYVVTIIEDFTGDDGDL